MSTESQSDRRGHHPDGFAEFTEELRLLAEVLLARVEPVLRRTAADGQADLGGCSWCPVCAAAALVRGEHHDVVAALADHGTSMVTVLREALAGVPVEPVLPPEWAEYAAAHHDSHGAYGYDDDRHGHTGTGWPTDDAARSGFPTPGTATPTDEVPAATEHGSDAAASTDTAQAAGRTRLRWGSARSSQAPRPRRVDEFEAPRAEGIPGTTAGRGTPPEHDGDTRTGPATQPADTARDDRSRSTRAPRSRYVDIPVTIRG
ncbi:hypothetical protein [Nocardia asteroides]|uniref:Uncharacterized protein n=1 Tax=Nocardia asteroides NBRC 15531 TaxID=1110697 RepID=U5EDJ8_NOCAS|nr:hypothetical protein [Nocardia asteroides]UGT46717.1 hypothetical protein LT345_19470 [Nocardia asteroides]GAD83259.1 hypothetical protein NCAST_18_01120 [Nocardia asteroides NBRC 15531]SFN62684.1 hypothetical protein SAMN05444423_11173 [Nocardia asteroides]VEG34435.1 Uncharacterised protein [Nocardia asteroides]